MTRIAPSPEPAREPASGRLRVQRVALAVRDLPRVAAFYRDVIGLQTLESEPGRTGLGVDGAVLLDLQARPDAAPDDPAGPGLFHTAFLLPGRAELGRWLAHCARRGVSLDGAADHLVSEAAYLHDPEGNGVEVYADRPAAAWRWRRGAAGMRVEMANRPLDGEGLRRAAAGAGWDGVPPGTRVGHVHLRVGDVAEAVRFYAGALGLDVTASWPGAAFLSTGGYHHHIAVNSWRSAGAGPRVPGRAGLLSVTFAGPGPADLRDPAGTLLHVRPSFHPQETP